MKKEIQSSSHIRLSYVTHFYCDEDAKFKSIQTMLANYAAYPKEVLDLVHFIIVDDGSPISYEAEGYGLNITWLKISDEIPWNNPGARNLGVTYAQSENVVISDTDHYLPADTLEYLCRRKNCGKNFYKFWRVLEDGSIDRPHPNLFLIARSRFMRFFGYDEEFCGDYAHDDVWFVKFQKWNGSVQRKLPRRFPAKRRKVDARHHTHSLSRDQETNEKLYREKRRLGDKFGEGFGHSRLFLDFAWEKVLYQQRPVPILKKDRFWGKLWWFRALNPFH